MCTVTWSPRCGEGSAEWRWICLQDATTVRVSDDPLLRVDTPGIRFSTQPASGP